MNWSPSGAHSTKEKSSFPVKLTRNNMFNRVIQVGCQKTLSIGNSRVKDFSMSLLIFVLFSSFCRRNKHLGLQLSSQFQMKMLKCWHVCRMDNLILIQLPLIYFPQTLWVFLSLFQIHHMNVHFPSVYIPETSVTLLYFNLSEGEAVLRGELKRAIYPLTLSHIPDFITSPWLSLRARFPEYLESKVWSLEAATPEIP